MRKVTLLGDSIRQIGYGPVVAERLNGRLEVFQPQDNGRFAKYTLRGLFDWRDGIAGSEVIHWNNGLWDTSDIFGDGLFTSPDEYISDMLRIARLLLKVTPHVIFATTTPVRDDNPHNHNSDIEKYNAMIVPELKKMGIAINDLYTALSPKRYEYIGEDKVHLTREGVEVCADLVVQAIESMLP